MKIGRQCSNKFLEARDSILYARMLASILLRDGPDVRDTKWVRLLIKLYFGYNILHSLNLLMRASRSSPAPNLKTSTAGNPVSSVSRFEAILISSSDFFITS